MSALGIPNLMLPAPELLATMTGSNVLIGQLLYTPIKIVFDNLSTVSVQILISYNGGASTIPWKTFAAGSALVLDDDLWAFPKGIYIYGNGASGNFSVAYTYAMQ